MPDRYGDDDRRGYRPPGAKLDIGGLPVCDSTHPQCCADLESYRKAHDDREACKTTAQSRR